jgi:hypothetical protein
MDHTTFSVNNNFHRWILCTFSSSSLPSGSRMSRLPTIGDFSPTFFSSGLCGSNKSSRILLGRQLLHHLHQQQGRLV